MANEKEKATDAVTAIIGKPAGVNPDAVIPRADQVGTLQCQPMRAMAQAMSETHAYTAEDRKVLADKAIGKVLVKVLTQQAEDCGLLRRTESKK